MPRYDFRAPRLYVDERLRNGLSLELGRTEANYLCNVLRPKAGDAVLVFNGRDGEWQAELAGSGKRSEGIKVAKPVTDKMAASYDPAIVKLYHDELARIRGGK